MLIDSENPRARLLKSVKNIVGLKSIGSVFGEVILCYITAAGPGFIKELEEICSAVGLSHVTQKYIQKEGR